MHTALLGTEYMSHQPVGWMDMQSGSSTTSDYITGHHSLLAAGEIAGSSRLGVALASPGDNGKPSV